MKTAIFRFYLRTYPLLDILMLLAFIAGIIAIPVLLSGCTMLDAAGRGVATGAATGTVSTPAGSASALEYIAYTVGSIVGSYVAIKGGSALAGKLGKKAEAP